MNFVRQYKEISIYRKKLDIITNNIHYPIATILCVIISSTSITPNMITLIAVICELLAVGLIYSDLVEYSVIIVIFLQLGWIFDLMDGMMARYKKMGYYHPSQPSNKGYYLDAISDHVIKFMILGALTYQYSLQNVNGWLLGLIAIIIHGITQTEHTLRKMILKSRTKSDQRPNLECTIMDHIALIMNNIYLFYLVFITINRIDLLLITYAGAESILFIKRVFQFWKSEL